MKANPGASRVAVLVAGAGTLHRHTGLGAMEECGFTHIRSYAPLFAPELHVHLCKCSIGHPYNTRVALAMPVIHRGRSVCNYVWAAV